MWMKHKIVIVVAKLDVHQMWREVKNQAIFKIFMIILHCSMFTMIDFSNVVFECVENCFSKLWKL